jgi:hypothetical protein
MVFALYHAHFLCRFAHTAITTMASSALGDSFTTARIFLSKMIISISAIDTDCACRHILGRLCQAKWALANLPNNAISPGSLSLISLSPMLAMKYSPATEIFSTVYLMLTLLRRA